MTAMGAAGELAQTAATETGRGTARLVVPVLGDLERAASLFLESAPNLRVGVLTGFFVPRAEPPAAETDGPLGAAQFASLINALGGVATVISDSRCAPFVQGFIDGADPLLDDGRRPDLFVADTPEGIDLDLTHVLSIERPGRSADGSYRNMFGSDISAFCAPLDDWFRSVDVPTIAIGDGGNEVGMGRLDPHIVAEVVDQGSLVCSVVSADALIVGGTSNWGAHALCAAIVSASAKPYLQRCLSESWCRRILDGGVRAGAVDGVLARRQATVDGLPWAQYWAIPRALNRIALGMDE